MTYYLPFTRTAAKQCPLMGGDKTERELLCRVVKLSNYLAPNCRSVAARRKARIGDVQRAARPLEDVHCRDFDGAHTSRAQELCRGCSSEIFWCFRKSGLHTLRAHPTLSLSAYLRQPAAGSFSYSSSKRLHGWQTHDVFGRWVCAHTKLFCTRTWGRKEKGP